MFQPDETEWNHTKMVFELSDVKGKTKIDFTHIGLVKGMECYSDCEWGWNNYISERTFCCYLQLQFFNHHRYRADAILIPVLRQALPVVCNLENTP
jgi:hypothetical protein